MLRCPTRSLRFETVLLPGEDYILAHTENPDAIYFLTLWWTKPKEEQARSAVQE